LSEIALQQLTYRLLGSRACCYNRSMPTALTSGASLLVLIVFSVWSIWSLASPQALTPVLRQQFTKRLVAAAIERTRHPVRYVPDYVRILYPNGDVPTDTGVCTDEIIRSYRAVGVDLQKEIHEDMVRNFSVYPNQKRWRLDHPDSNIDHRRVPNLMVFFQRKGETLAITNRAADYAPGDLVTWGTVCRMLASLWIRRSAGATITWSSTTLEQARKWRTFCLVGRLLATIATSAQRVPNDSI